MTLSSFLRHRINFWDADWKETPVEHRRRIYFWDVDWKETPAEHVFKANLPGLKKEEVQLQVEGERTLSISGQRNKEEVQKTDTWHRVERNSGQFIRKFRLPENANMDRMTAKMGDGVLTVVVPKEEKKASKERSLEIGGHDGQQGDTANKKPS